VDATRSEPAADVEILKRLPPAQRRIRVMNKIDLIPRAPALERQADETRVWLSAKTGEGVNLLRDALLEGAGWQDTSESLFLARARHVQALRRARLHLANANQELGRSEIFAEELRLAHEALGAIVGEYTPDDLLGEIFSRFCIGK
jgi:tRNA modification GTPase